MQITGNTILITGGGSGIGEAIAVALHAKGNKIILAGRRRETLEAVAARHPGMAVQVLDVADAGDIAAAAAKVVQDHPALNVLINNAGIMQAEDLTAADTTIAEATIATNLLGPIRLTAALLPHLTAQAASTVINVTSGLAFVPLAATATYNATKAAMHSYSQSLRSQLAGTSVRVIEWAPPAVATDLMPGHAQNPNSMPLADFISESMALLEGQPGAEEILVERVKFLRHAEARGDYAKVFGMLNQSH
jgi:uncharacterized oxidoreductase